VAIFSSKGQTTTATRMLVETLSTNGVTILVVHDFDVAGLTTAHWLSHDNDRYQFQHRPKVIDLGLRLAEAKKLGLQSEEQVHKQQKDPTEKFLEYFDDPVSNEEADFLRGEYSHWVGKAGGWIGQRVELNMMTPAQFIRWLERKLREAKVEKVVPGKKILAGAWKRAVVIAKALKLIKKEETDHVAAPKKLEKKVRAMLKRNPELSWDESLVQIAEEHQRATDGRRR
jgi:hypothetical protein